MDHMEYVSDLAARFDYARSLNKMLVAGGGGICVYKTGCGGREIGLLSAAQYAASLNLRLVVVFRAPLRDMVDDICGRVGPDYYPFTTATLQRHQIQFNPHLLSSFRDNYVLYWHFDDVPGCRAKSYPQFQKLYQLAGKHFMVGNPDSHLPEFVDLSQHKKYKLKLNDDYDFTQNNLNKLVNLEVVNSESD